MSVKTLRKIAIFWCLFIGLGAVWGSIGMFVDISGKFMKMDELLPYFQKLPFADVVFQNFLFPGIALLIVNGVTQLITCYLLLHKKLIGTKCSIGCGIILMLWICIQFYAFPLNVLSCLYFVFGALETATGILLYRGETRGGAYA